MKWTSTTTFIACIACFSLDGCTYNCACDETLPEQTKTLTSHPIPQGEHLLNECTYINEGITESIAFSEKLAKSRYAIYYQAMSRERVSELQTRAKEIGCP